MMTKLVAAMNSLKTALLKAGNSGDSDVPSSGTKNSLQENS